MTATPRDHDLEPHRRTYAGFIRLTAASAAASVVTLGVLALVLL